MLRAFFLVALLLSISLSPAPAQEAPGPLDASNPPRAWMTTSVGLGGGAGNGTNGSVGGSTNIGPRTRSLLGQIAVNSNWSTESRPADTDRPYTVNAGLNAGWGWARHDMAVAGFAGPALGWERRRSGTLHRRGGVMLGAQFFVTPAQGFGLGVDAFTFLHPDHPEVGIRLAIQIGNAWTP